MPAGTPALWLIAGPNGAGKTTLVRHGPLSGVLPDVSALNPDDATLALLRVAGIQHFADAPPDTLRVMFARAADQVLAEAQRLIADGKAVCLETVLSTEKYLPLVERVAGQGGFFGLIYIATASPGICISRVACRVAQGGHDVPATRIAGRWRRSLELLPKFAARASHFWIFDNSDATSDKAPPLVVEGRDGKVTFIADGTFAELSNAIAGLRR